MKRPVVLMVDDDRSDIDARAMVLRGRASVITRTPSEVTPSDLRNADVVLVDYRISDWPERDALSSVALKPCNGVALAAVLRSFADEHIAEKRRAFTIHSGVLHDLSGGLTSKSREHAIARTLNLEWVFPKQGDPATPQMGDQVAVLAKAIARLPREWPKTPEKAASVLFKLLDTPAEASWRERALADVDSCHPPIHAWSAATHGMAFIRWLLHQVLPFPCFLWEERYLAARLRVTAESLRQILEESSKARRALGQARYNGVLAGFLGARWWRAGIEHLLWQWTNGDPFNGNTLHEVVRERLSPDVVPLALARPVVCVDVQSLRPTDTTIEATDAVQVQPDDWPPYAEQAWVALADASEASLLALVVPQDRDRVQRSDGQ